MPASLVELEDGHVVGGAAHEQDHEDGGDGDVDAFGGCAAELPYLWEVRWSLWRCLISGLVYVHHHYWTSILSTYLAGHDAD